MDDPSLIDAIIKDYHESISMIQFFYNFSDHRARHARNSNIRVPSNSAITIVLEAYLPLADTDTAKKIFSILCRDVGNPDLVRAFIKLSGSKLTSDVMSVGLDAVLSAPRQQLIQSRFSDIIEEHIDKIDQQSYWAAINICCQDQRSDLVEKLIELYGCPPDKQRPDQLQVCAQFCCVNEDMQMIKVLISKYEEIICEHLLTRCTYLKSLSVLKTLLDGYEHLLTTKAIIAGFDSACKTTAAAVIKVYLDYFDLFSDSRFDAKAIGLSCRAGLDDAIMASATKVVDVLLNRCLSFLQFESGHKSLLPCFGPREGMMSNCCPESLVGPNADISRLMRDAYGPRVTAGFSYWSIEALVSP